MTKFADDTVVFRVGKNCQMYGNIQGRKNPKHVILGLQKGFAVNGQ